MFFNQGFLYFRPEKNKFINPRLKNANLIEHLEDNLHCKLQVVTAHL